MKYRKAGFLTVASAAAATALGVFAGPATAAAPTTQQITCNGHQLTIRTNNNSSSMNGGWSVAQIVAGGSGHLIPTSFSLSAYDVTRKLALFSGTQVKGNGNANHTQQTVTCTQTMTGTLAMVLGPVPADQLPPGVRPTDTVTATFTATAVHRP